MDELSRDDSVASEWAYRACIECDHVWAGVMTCPKCGAPGEPLEPGCPHCGSMDLRYDPTTDTTDCAACGEKIQR